MIADIDLVDALFRTARSHNGWTDRAVTDDQLRELYELTKWGPTSANCSPMRLIFLRSESAKRRLEPHLSAGNVTKTATAPVTAIIGYDTEFYHHLPRLFPHNPAIKETFKDSKHAEATAFRNGTLQAAYLIMAARAVGLDCGPMSGFDAEAVDREFWGGTAIRTNFLCNLGYGDHDKLFGRHPRFSFEDVCSML